MLKAPKIEFNRDKFKTWCIHLLWFSTTSRSTRGRSDGSQFVASPAPFRTSWRVTGGVSARGSFMALINELNVVADDDALGVPVTETGECVSVRVCV